MSFRASSMAALSNFLLALLSALFLLHFSCGLNQNPSGFISLDCGLPANSTYTEPTTGIIYESDAAFINSGEVHKISSDSIPDGLKQPLWSLRSFPDGIRNCYDLKVRTATKYLIRAAFRYGNYDGRSFFSEFELHLGVNFWDRITFKEYFTVRKEIVHFVSSSNVQICVVNVGTGTPFISALELRSLEDSVYETGTLSLARYFRLDLGSIDNQSFRYPDDVYDRIWFPATPREQWTSISTSGQAVPYDRLSFHPPPAVMKTAATPLNISAPLELSLVLLDTATKIFVYLYFAELQLLSTNQSRAFEIFLNGERWYSSTISLNYLQEYIVYSTSPSSGGTFQFSLVKTPNSTLPPILNAIEVYTVLNLPESETNQQDVEAIANIKATYAVIRNWQGDPCVPRKYIWQGLECSNGDSSPPRITSLDLSSNGLTGVITHVIANLKMLETLDLSNNSLSGSVPDFLAELPSLRALNVERNNLSGIIPPQLMEMSKSGSLSLRYGENPNLFAIEPSEKKERHVVLIVAAVGGFVVLLLIIAAVIFCWRFKGRNQPGEVKQNFGQSSSSSSLLEPSNRHYSYTEILTITNNFERLLGEGGFGRVYYGCIGKTQVAVKMLSSQSARGYQQFQTEVQLLMRVHHRNLTTLIGYCNETTNKGLIYGYMGKKDLGSLISGGKSYLLNWKNRLRIAIDAAQGLEYLHSGITPSIVHRDVKTSNILLDDNFQAKVSDFGLSRTFSMDGGTSHVTTNVAGTPGYLDPEYYTLFRLTEKSDVYGFGIVLLEIITGKPALMKTRDNVTHIYQWVESILSRGDIGLIIDPKLKGDFDVNSIWKAVDIAMSCTSSDSANRPNMSQVVVELKQCLAMELACSKDQELETMVADSISLFNPMPR